MASTLLFVRRSRVSTYLIKPLMISQVRYSHYPPHVDWRGKNVLGPVSSNGTKIYCCYADAARVAIQSIIAITSGQNTILSTQELMSPTYRAYESMINRGSNENEGEKGGREEECYEYVSNFGLSSSLRWPLGQASVINMMKLPKVWIDGHVLLPPNNKDLLFRAMAQQPLTAILDGDGMFELGFTRKKSYDLHSVVLIGYDSISGTVTFQNNWGPSWRKEGFEVLHLDRPNCRVALNVSYPVIDHFSSALDAEMEKLGHLFRRKPVGIPAILRFPYVVGGSFIGIRYSNGVIVSSGYGNERLKQIGSSLVIGVEEPIWDEIKDVGGCNNPVDVLERLIGVLSKECNNMNRLRRPFIIIAGVQNGKKYLGMAMGTLSHHHDAYVLQEQLENLDFKEVDHDIVTEFDSRRACYILEQGWHADMSLEDALRLVDASVTTHLCHHRCVLQVANITGKGVSFFRHLV